MTSGCLLSLVFPLLTGSVTTRLLWPKNDRIPAPLPFTGGLSVGLGFGLSSCLFFLSRSLTDKTTWIVGAEAILCVLLGFLLWQRGKLASLSARGTFDRSPAARRVTLIVGTAFFFTLVIGFAAFISLTLKAPHGQWDAWAIWNMRARFIFRGGHRWIEAFTPLLSWSHPDYPLLLPASVARAWHYSGVDSVLAPALVAALFTFATLGLLVGSVTALRGRVQGYLAGLTLLATPFFIRHGASQYADVPLSLFLLASISLLCLHDRFGANSPGLLAAAGIVAGLAGWTKNEGLVFLLAVTGARLVAAVRLRGWRDYFGEVRWYLVGLAPVLGVILYFKIALAPSNDLFAAGGLNLVWERTSDISRHLAILKSFALAAFSLGGYRSSLLAVLLVYAVLVGRAERSQNRTGQVTAMIALAGMMAGYFLSYLATPYELDWHLATSAKRLFLQIWPSLLFAYFVTIRTPAETVTSLSKRPARKRPSKADHVKSVN